MRKLLNKLSRKARIKKIVNSFSPFPSVKGEANWACGKQSDSC